MHDELEQHVLRDRAYLDLVHRTALEYWEGPLACLAQDPVACTI